MKPWIRRTLIGLFGASVALGALTACGHRYSHHGWNASPEEGDADEDPEAILEDFASDPTRAELAGFIDALNDDEQAELVALTWVGRGTFEPEEFDEAVETAKSERINATARYLLGIPLLADYLQEGLEKMGFSAEDVESDVL